MPTLERARAKHNEIVAQLTKAVAAKDKALNILIRKEAKRVECERAVIRSAKRLDKIRAAAIHTNGPTATVHEEALVAVKAKPTPKLKADDVPTLTKAKVEPTAKAIASAMQEAGFNYVATSRNDVKAKAPRKRRSADDFKADMDARKDA